MAAAQPFPSSTAAAAAATTVVSTSVASMSSKQGALPVKSWREVDGVKTGLAVSTSGKVRPPFCEHTSDLTTLSTAPQGYDLSEYMVCIVGGVDYSWLLRQDGEPTIGKFKKMPMCKKMSDLGKMWVWRSNGAHLYQSMLPRLTPPPAPHRYSQRKARLMRVIDNKKLLEKKIRLHRRKNTRKTIELPVVAHLPRVAQPPPPSPPPPELGLNKLETAAWKDQQRLVIRKKTQSPAYLAAAIKQGQLRAKV